MKKQINVRIYKNGSESDVLLRLIGNVNEGKGNISPLSIAGYFTVRNIMYPSTTNLKMVAGDNPDEYHISEDGGKSFTMSLEWIEVEELQDAISRTIFGIDPESEAVEYVNRDEKPDTQ